MSGSTEKPSKRRLPDQQPSNASAKKKQRNNVALAEAFLREDYSFRPPPGLREHMSGPASRPTKKTLPKKLTRPTKTNGRDPFQHLNDDEIHQIIRYLDAKDTETMRRVSKFWKATSEHHCSKSVLLQHLPWATSNDIDSLSNEELNIYYRRQLYLYENLQRGFATRAFQVNGVRDWHLNGSLLMFSNGADKAAVRALRTGTAGGTQLTSEDEPIEFGDEIQRSKLETPYLQLTNNGNVIAVFRAYTSKADFTDSISLITTQEANRWHLPLEGFICKPAIGKTAIYFIEAPRSNGVRSSYGPAFKKVSLADGSLLYATFPPQIYETGVFIRQDQEEKPSSTFSKVASPTSGRRIEVAELDTSLKLSGNESIAIWCDLHLRFYIFSAVTGQILFTYNRSKPSNLSVSVIKPQVWDFSFHPNGEGVDSVRLTSYNERTERLSYAYGANTDVDARFVDADCPIGFDFRHSMAILDEETRDPFTTIGVMGVEKRIDEYPGLSSIWLEPSDRPNNPQITSKEATLVTLPPKKGQTERRVLELETPWVVGKDDFFGIVQGYLVYHNFTDQELIVLDFWPKW